QLPELVSAELTAECPEGWNETPPVPDLEDHPSCVCTLRRRVDIRRADAAGLLAEDRQPVGRTCRDQRAMKRRGRRDEDRINRLGVERGREVGVRTGPWIGLCRARTRLDAWVHDGGDLDSGRSPQRLKVRAAHPAHPDQQK